MKVRLYVNAPLTAAGEVVTVSSEQHHYLRRVLRLDDDASVFMFNGRDGEWQGTLQAQGKKHTAVLLQQQTRQQQPPDNVGLLFAPVKKTPTDFIAQKATELGAAWLQPVQTARTIVTRVNTERLLANATEAAEQTGRLEVPDIHPAAALDAALQELAPETRLLFCDERRTAPPLLKALQQQPGRQVPWAILIGPEGGFTDEEAALVRGYHHCVPCHLGERLLRADTAALAALAGWGFVYSGELVAAD